jgi:steroid delta-isomerase-like uncharacterized protein
MAAITVERHRAGHEAFNRRDFAAMTAQYADHIRWTDRARALTFTTPAQFREEFLAGWVQASSDIRITDPAYLDAGRASVATFTVSGTHDGPLGPFPATGRPFALELCELWRFDPDGRVVGGDLYYDQVSLLMQLDLLPQPSSA